MGRVHDHAPCMSTEVATWLRRCMSTEVAPWLRRCSAQVPRDDDASRAESGSRQDPQIPNAKVLRRAPRTH